MSPSGPVYMQVSGSNHIERDQYLERPYRLFAREGGTVGVACRRIWRESGQSELWIDESGKDFLDPESQRCRDAGRYSSLFDISDRLPPWSDTCR
jgi:hypothetical protein